MCPSRQSDLDLPGERQKDCHGRECTEIASMVQNESVSESGGIWYYRTQIYAGRIRLFSISLWLSASSHSVDTPLQLLPLLVVGMFLWRAQLT